MLDLVSQKWMQKMKKKVFLRWPLSGMSRLHEVMCYTERTEVDMISSWPQVDLASFCPEQLTRQCPLIAAWMRIRSGNIFILQSDENFSPVKVTESEYEEVKAENWILYKETFITWIYLLLCLEPYIVKYTLYEQFANSIYLTFKLWKIIDCCFVSKTERAQEQRP